MTATESVGRCRVGRATYPVSITSSVGTSVRSSGRLRVVRERRQPGRQRAHETNRRLLVSSHVTYYELVALLPRQRR